MKITVTRSFDSKIQLREYEPISSFCCIAAEFESNGLDAGAIAEISAQLDAMARDEVRKTIVSIKEKKAAPAPLTFGPPHPAPAAPAHPPAPANVAAAIRKEEPSTPAPDSQGAVQLSGNDEVDVVALAGHISRQTGQPLTKVIFDASSFENEKGETIGFRMPAGKSAKWVKQTLGRLKKQHSDLGFAAAVEKAAF